MMNSNMDVVNSLTEIDSFNPNVQELLSLTTHVGFSDHNRQQSQIPFCFSNDASHNPNANHPHHLQVPLDFESAAQFFPQGGVPISHGCNDSNSSLSEPDYLANSSSRGSASAGIPVNKPKGTYNYGEKKRKRSNGKETEKPKEVVHVRAKRGQATDSHSLAERMRREKINQKLRCLQDLVPGCYKSMGMAVMLDVIINYVRSLQNQIDFLSMKLSAASLFYDFNSLDMDAVPPTQACANFPGPPGCEAQGLEKMVGEGYGELPQFHTSWPL